MVGESDGGVATIPQLPRTNFGKKCWTYPDGEVQRQRYAAKVCGCEW